LPEPNRFILNVGFFVFEEAAKNLSITRGNKQAFSAPLFLAVTPGPE
jgi:hypothetical protein